MVALFSFLAIIVLSIIAVRIGAISLELTGLSPEIASFQAQSAFSGVGFTTSESEALVNHPVRRRIVRVLILLGGAGVTSSIATLILAFIGEQGKQFMARVFALFLGITFIYLFARSKFIYHIMRNIISAALQRWTTMRVFDYEQLLGLSEGYSIARIAVRGHSWLNNKKLSEVGLGQEHILILAVYRKVEGKEKFIGTPTGDTTIRPGDVLICYSRKDVSEAFAKKDDRAERNNQSNSAA